MMGGGKLDGFGIMLSNRFTIEALLKKYGFIKEFNEGDDAQEFFAQGDRIYDFTTELEKMMYKTKKLNKEKGRKNV